LRLAASCVVEHFDPIVRCLTFQTLDGPESLR